MPEPGEYRKVFETDEGHQVKPFSEWLVEHRRGRLDEDLSLELHDLVQQVDATQKAGVLTLKIQVKPKGDLQIEIQADSTVKAPKPDAAPAHYFVDRHGNPSRHDPMQQPLFNDTEEKS